MKEEMMVKTNYLRRGSLLFMLTSLAVLLWLVYPEKLPVAVGEPVIVTDDSGIELTGRTADEPPPLDWRVYDAETEEQVKRIRNRWGFAALPPGRYVVAVQQSGQDRIRYAEVEVRAGEIACVAVDSGIELTGRTADEPPPSSWNIYDVETGERVTRVFNRWGFAALPPGRYVVAVQSYGLDRIRYAEVEVRAGETMVVAVNSGIELLPVPGVPAPEWSITDENGRRISRLRDWNFSPLPAGTYVVTVLGIRRTVQVEPGRVTELTVADLGLGFLDIELPAAKGVQLASGFIDLEVALVRQDADQAEFHRIREGIAATGMSLWIRAGPAKLRMRSGEMVINQSVEVPRGERVVIHFDAATVASKNGLSLFRIMVRDEQGQERTDDTQIAILDGPDTPRDLERAREIQRSGVIHRGGAAPRLGQRLLALIEDADSDRLWLAPPNILVRARLDTHEEWREAGTPGERQDLIFDLSSHAADPEAPISVDIEIQSPEDGKLVTESRVTVTGRATTTGWGASRTRIAIVIDISGSTADNTGVDIDGDGEPNTIIEAEVMAARWLLDELEKVESSKSGSVFEVAVVAFDHDAYVAGTLTRMSDPGGVASLRSALDQILADGPQGGTNFEAAFDVSMKELSSPEHFGEKVIVFLSDGLPNNVLIALDGAARAGLAGVAIHSFGIGPDFEGELPSQVRFPPHPSEGPDIIATVTAAGAPGGIVRALPNPADIVDVVTELPIFELPEAEIEEVQVVNATTGEPAFRVELTPDGFFEANVPVSLVPSGNHETNTLMATAIAIDGVSEATDQIMIRGEEMTFGLSADVLFDFDEADLRPEAEPVLMELAETLYRFPQAQIQILGHTDSIGSDTYNLRLSQLRAESVKSWLTEHAGIESSRLTTTGLGSSQPVAPNTNPDGSDNPEGRQKNRRVEIIVRE